jgi:putative tryptophan/tyrosine transport system substrate-binding protein
MSAKMNRREFITLLGGAAAAWPLATRAQQLSPALIGFFNAGAATTLKRDIDAFRDGLRTLGHIEARNVRFDHRRSANREIDSR